MGKFPTFEAGVYTLLCVGVTLFAGCTGEGSAELDPTFHFLDSVQNIRATVVTMPPKGRILGTQEPRGAQHVGAIGLGYGPLDSSGEPVGVMSFWFYIQWTDQLISIPNWQAGAQFYGTLFWRLAGGAVVDITTVV